MLGSAPGDLSWWGVDGGSWCVQACVCRYAGIQRLVCLGHTRAQVRCQHVYQTCAGVPVGSPVQVHGSAPECGGGGRCFGRDTAQGDTEESKLACRGLRRNKERVV